MKRDQEQRGAARTGKPIRKHAGGTTAERAAAQPRPSQPPSAPLPIPLAIAADGTFEVFLVAIPGLEQALLAEAKQKNFAGAALAEGGVTVRGRWPDIWRANLELRGASRIQVRIAAFRAMHLAQLDKRARRVAWGDVLRADFPFRVQASCQASRIYHSGAAAERVGRAIHETIGAPQSEIAQVIVKVRIVDDLCSISIDASGEPLHKRGHKQEVNAAPMRETMAALLLYSCGYRGGEPVLDPMCGSGTFVIEAAEIASGLMPGRSRAFAFEQFANFDRSAFEALKTAPTCPAVSLQFYGRDRDPGAIRMSRANAERAGIGTLCDLAVAPIDVLTRPEGDAGLVMINPPYGGRIGDRAQLVRLYREIGQNLQARLSGWRVGLVTNERALAEATGLTFTSEVGPILHGGIKVTLFATGALA